MRFYLSSYKLGNEVERLRALIPENTKTAFIPNALDFATDLDRRAKSERADIDDLESLGLDVHRLDLREYFDRPEELAAKLAEFGVLWVRGGNVFVLRRAMQKSGFDEALRGLSESDILYGGYSAGVCVLGPTLHGLDLVDDPETNPYGDASPTIFEGLGVLGFTIVPHDKSDHPESEAVDGAVASMEREGIPYQALRDGEVIIVH